MFIDDCRGRGSVRSACVFALSLVALCGVGGCGDGDDPGGGNGATKAEVVATVDSYLAAMREGDARAVCRYLLPPSARKPSSSIPDCVTEMQEQEGFGDIEQETPDVRSVDIDGGRATVTFEGSREPLGLVEEGDRWYLTALTEAR